MRYSKYSLKKCISFSILSKMILKCQYWLAASKIVAKKSSFNCLIWLMFMKMVSACSLVMIFLLTRGVWKSETMMLRSLM